MPARLVKEKFLVGTLEERPPAGKKGFEYFAEDESTLYVDTGKRWARVITSETPAAVNVATEVFDQEEEPESVGDFLWIKRDGGGKVMDLRVRKKS